MLFRHPDVALGVWKATGFSGDVLPAQAACEFLRDGSRVAAGDDRHMHGFNRRFKGFPVEGMSARGRTRTCDLPVISRVLQPTKLPALGHAADLTCHQKDDGKALTQIQKRPFR